MPADQKQKANVRLVGTFVPGTQRVLLNLSPFTLVDGDQHATLNLSPINSIGGGQRGAKLSLLNVVSKDQSGLNFGALGNAVQGNQSGLNLGFLFNECFDTQEGCTVSGLWNSAASQFGLAIGAFNLVDKTVKGAVFSLYARAGELLHGFAAGMCINISRFRGVILSPVTLIKDAEHSAGLILGLVIIRLDKEGRDRLRFLFLRCDPDAKEKSPEHSQQSLRDRSPRPA
ncbi:MAG: hypothetical protein WC488_01955 [Candidatus Micrarchaeia archaeon]